MVRYKYAERSVYAAGISGISERLRFLQSGTVWGKLAPGLGDLAAARKDKGVFFTGTVYRQN